VGWSKGSTTNAEQASNTSVRGVFELKPSYIKRKDVNNYFEEKLKNKGEDKVLEEHRKDSR
jgi:hypothetical protein